MHMKSKNKQQKMVLKYLEPDRNKDGVLENGLEDMGRGKGKLG